MFLWISGLAQQSKPKAQSLRKAQDGVNVPECVKISTNYKLRNKFFPWAGYLDFGRACGSEGRREILDPPKHLKSIEFYRFSIANLKN